MVRQSTIFYYQSLEASSQASALFFLFCSHSCAYNTAESLEVPVYSSCQHYHRAGSSYQDPVTTILNAIVT